MIYLDTSLLVALCVTEPESARVDAWLAQQTSETIGTSLWALTETASALGIKVRRRDITRGTALKALDLLERHLLSMLVLLDVPSTAFARSEVLLRSFELGLRAGDALHLAICLGDNSTVLATADAKLYAAATELTQASIKVY